MLVNINACRIPCRRRFSQYCLRYGIILVVTRLGDWATHARLAVSRPAPGDSRTPTTYPPRLAERVRCEKPLANISIRVGVECTEQCFSGRVLSGRAARAGRAPFIFNTTSAIHKTARSHRCANKN